MKISEFINIPRNEHSFFIYLICVLFYFVCVYTLASVQRLTCMPHTSSTPWDSGEGASVGFVCLWSLLPHSSGDVLGPIWIIQANLSSSAAMILCQVIDILIHSRN